VTAAGIVIAVAASVVNAFAIVLQAGEDRQAPLSRGGRLSLLVGLARRPRWLAGTGLMVLAWPLQVLALAFAPITVVQPLLSTTQLVLLGVARVKLRERVGHLEALGALSIVAGVAAVVWAAPRHTVHDSGAARLALPLVVVGGAALVAYVLARVRPRAQLAVVIGAGLAYAWVDFANKLLANDLSANHWGYALLWLAATVAFGALAFLEETTALQRRPAVTVAPVVGAIHDPLPVLMALWAGVEAWGSAPHRIVPLIAGLAVIALGAAILGRSDAVARVSGDAEATAGPRRRIGSCAPLPVQHYRGDCGPGTAEAIEASAG
jgi:drug/metabolite transporter (DMT)-like permease